MGAEDSGGRQGTPKASGNKDLLHLPSCSRDGVTWKCHLDKDFLVVTGRLRQQSLSWEFPGFWHMAVQR